MRLLVVTQYFWPESFRVNDLVEGMVARGHSVTVLTGRPNYPEGRIHESYASNPAAFATYAGARVVRVPLRPRGRGKLRLVLNYWSFIFWATLLGPWRLRGEAFDVIFFFDTSPITSALPAIVLRRVWRIPLVMWVLDLWPETLSAVNVVRSPRGLALVGSLVAFIYRHCDLILAQSRAFFGNIEHWSGDKTRIRYFPGWAEPIFTGDAALLTPAAEVVPYTASGFNVMFAGNIGHAQDFPAILAAAARLRHRPEIRFLVVGDGRAAEETRQDVARLGLASTVIFLGKHPLERMPSFFLVADALLVSLRAEPIFALTIPGKVQPYLAAGVPILGMLDGEGARVIEESGAGFTCPAGDGEGLAAIIERLLGLRPAERQAMGERGRQYCRREFDRDMLFERLEGWLHDVTAGGVGHPGGQTPPAV
ncbi:MAG: glycosyltransferase WbuB [Planctomycetota bacterium]|nr:MAG: glycosyltransferase WbuB [Planctomycetota bacterium]